MINVLNSRYDLVGNRGLIVECIIRDLYYDEENDEEYQNDLLNFLYPTTGLDE